MHRTKDALLQAIDMRAFGQQARAFFQHKNALFLTYISACGIIDNGKKRALIVCINQESQDA